MLVEWRADKETDRRRVDERIFFILDAEMPHADGPTDRAMGRHRRADRRAVSPSSPSPPATGRSDQGDHLCGALLASGVHTPSVKHGAEARPVLLDTGQEIGSG